MIKAIVLDSTPLGLLVRRRGFKAADACRDWLHKHLAARVRIYVPAIIVYELRRELLRIDSSASLQRLDRFLHADADRYLPLADEDLGLAASLWAEARKEGRVTADPQALDIDVILAAQSLTLGLPKDQFVVATANVAHISLFVPAKTWHEI